MFYYKAEAKIIYYDDHAVKNESGGATPDDKREYRSGFHKSDEWASFKECSSQHSNEFYQRSGNKTFIFTTGINNSAIINIGMISKIETDTEKLISEYLSLIGAKFQDIASSEVTLETIHSMLQASSRCNLIDDDQKVLEKFRLGSLIGRYVLLVNAVRGAHRGSGAGAPAGSYRRCSGENSGEI